MDRRNQVGLVLLLFVAFYIVTLRSKLSLASGKIASDENTYVWKLFPNLPQDWIYNVPQKRPQNWFISVNNIPLPDKPLAASLDPMHNPYAL